MHGESARGAPLVGARGKPARIVLVVNEDWMFWSHRLALARAARDAGAEVTVATRVGAHGARIAGEGFHLVSLGWRRGARNPAVELRALWRLFRLYRRVRPDLVHHVGVKAALYGGAAAWIARSGAQVHTLAGFGWVSTSSRRRARILRVLVHVAFRRVLSRAGAHLVVQNPDDEAEVRRADLFAAERVHLVPGSGVDTRRFAPSPEPAGPVTAVLAGRLVRSKGVVELAEAARMLRARGARVRVRLVGDPDPENPETVTAAQLRGWHAEGILEWTARVDDMAAVWSEAHIGVLPSYREGMPRTLLEAAACGRALVATNVPGCREIVRDGDSGLLVPLHDVAALADAIARLAGDDSLRRRMGRRARERVEASYGDGVIVAQMLSLYRRAIAGGGAE
jgi:glycosyltransferase involved in cell wall biosynthesis